MLWVSLFAILGLCAAPLSAAEQAPPDDPRLHWAFQKPVRAQVPAGPTHPVDAFLAPQLTQHKLTPRPLADKATLLRRLSLDLVGLPPTREELHAFLQDESVDAYEKVVDRLLASPAHGERWARHWMDVWRYSDWYGRRHVPDVWNSAPQIWRWRDWIVQSLNHDHGYDRMVREMLAADEICPDDYEASVATGYLIRNWYALNPNDWMRNTVEHSGKAFLGLTFNCAHCHDHKYDPITQEDYFRFRAFFEPIGIRQDRVVGEADPGLFQEYDYSKLRKVQRLGLVRIFDKNPSAPTWFYTAGDERNRVKERGSLLPGLPTFLASAPIKVEPIDLPIESWYPGSRPALRETLLAEAKALLSSLEAQLKITTEAKAKALVEAKLRTAQAELASLTARFAADQARYSTPPAKDLAKQIQAASKSEREATLRKAELTLLTREQILADAEAKPTTEPTRAKLIETEKKELTAAQAARTKAQADLADEKLAEKYTPFSPQYPKTSTGRRKALATWLTGRENPLTARVAVNHVWLRHFHAPLAANVFDLGRNSAKPNHPELLDWLAVEFMESGWSMKHLHKLLVTSDAYRRATSVGEAQACAKLDPENRLYWRMNSGRMEAEVVRDALLFLAGKLDTKLGGQELENTQALTTFRRTLYYATYPEDGGKNPLGELFDGPDSLECYRRTRSIVPQQALALTNSDLIHQLSVSLAKNVWQSTGENAKFVAGSFEQILCRRPTSAELASCVDYLPQAPGDSAVASKARESLVRALFNHNDFLTIR